MKTALGVLCLFFLADAALSEPSDGQVSWSVFPFGLAYFYTTLYNESGCQGANLTLYNPAPFLYDFELKNQVVSVHQMGMWIYYENENFNSDVEGQVFYVHGIDVSTNFPYVFRDMTSSLRYAGISGQPNQGPLSGSWTFYEGLNFQGSQFDGTVDTPFLDHMDLKASSLITTGQDPWTLYSDRNYNGDSICVFPNHYDRGITYEMDLGIYVSMKQIGIPDNSVRSLKRGCHSNQVAPTPQLKHEYRTENGGWGYATP